LQLKAEGGFLTWHGHFMLMLMVIFTFLFTFISDHCFTLLYHWWSYFRVAEC
jgi:hypothetical protein